MLRIHRDTQKGIFRRNLIKKATFSLLKMTLDGKKASFSLLKMTLDEQKATFSS